MISDLFTPISRDDRQKECLKAWIKSEGKSSIVACTGFGKTRVGLNAIKFLIKQIPDLTILVVVPTEPLQKQWIQHLDENGLSLNGQVQIINSAIKQRQQFDFLILDEIHRYSSETFIQILSQVKYKYILGLTATFERLDGKHEIMSKYCPVVDEIPIEVAKANGWVAEFNEYQVVISVDDIEVYQNYHKQFCEHYEFFNWNFGLAMSMIGKDGLKNRLNLRDELCPNGTKAEKSEVLKNITYHAMGFNRAMQDRKKFVNNHIAKIDVCKEIIKHRFDKKIITFSANVKMAESIGVGEVYTGKTSKKRSSDIMTNFRSAKEGVLNSCSRVNEGADIPGVSVAIIMGLDSSQTKATQRTGRAIRKEGSKYAEIFNLVIEDTIETKWFSESHKKVNYITIDVENLYKLLKGEDYETYHKKIKNYQFRF